ncbi:MAG: KTSC domain-containing protein [Desulfitobacteriaceae bacterium]|nr:KTSC domain-containing protein [Desulfitobacteriaceae bacterium]
MERKYIDSSMIVSIGYDSQQAVLEIEFKSNGQIWQYFDIPEYMWYEIEAASSVGKYFHSNIKGAFAENRVG